MEHDSSGRHRSEGGIGLTPDPPSPSRTRRFSRPARVLGLVGLTLAVAAGSALAYWRVFGAGSSAAAAGSLGTPTVVAFTGGDAPTSSLLPGGSSDVILRVNNPNAYTLTITAIAGNGAITASGGVGTCTTTGVSTTFPSSPSIAVASGSHLIDLAGAASMSTASQTGCQGATFAIPVSLTFTK